jgi:hypothetical protein
LNAAGLVLEQIAKPDFDGWLFGQMLRASWRQKRADFG